MSEVDELAHIRAALVHLRSAVSELEDAMPYHDNDGRRVGIRGLLNEAGEHIARIPKRAFEQSGPAHP